MAWKPTKEDEAWREREFLRAQRKLEIHGTRCEGCGYAGFMTIEDSGKKRRRKRTLTCRCGHRRQVFISRFQTMA